ncbi:ParB N-terminal domain-containing protein [Desulfosarcina sp. OttesenSCG-928-B08]|nr:ParB N-terminal domain-containing protein [Desulfosarcina sp. OttesenSCG-928-B08]
MAVDIRDVRLSDIDLSDLTFKITTRVDKTDLALSIRAVGLLQPPVLRPVAEGFSVVCGFRRIHAMILLHQTEISARVLPETVSPLVCACMAISDNTGQRHLNTVEQARAYALIHRLTPSGENWQDLARSVGLPDSEAAKNRIMPVAAMPDVLQSAILENSIALPVALALNELPPDVRDPLIAFMRPLAASLSVQREVMEMILELSARDRLSVRQVIQLPEMTAILEDADTPVPQKVRKLRDLLKALRYPAITRAGKRYAEAMRALNPDPRIQIQPPRDFEAKAYHLTLSLCSRQDLDALWPDLQKIAAAIERADWLT